MERGYDEHAFSAKGLKNAKHELDILKLPDQECLPYAAYQDDLHYQASMVESSYTVGMMKGEKKGRKDRDIEIARNLLTSGLLDIENIAETTGLTPEEVRLLKPEE